MVKIKRAGGSEPPKTTVLKSPEPTVAQRLQSKVARTFAQKSRDKQLAAIQAENSRHWLNKPDPNLAELFTSLATLLPVPEHDPRIALGIAFSGHPAAASVLDAYELRWIETWREHFGHTDEAMIAEDEQLSPEDYLKQKVQDAGPIDFDSPTPSLVPYTIQELLELVARHDRTFKLGLWEGIYGGEPGTASEAAAPTSREMPSLTPVQQRVWDYVREIARNEGRICTRAELLAKEKAFLREAGADPSTIASTARNNVHNSLKSLERKQVIAVDGEEIHIIGDESANLARNLQQE
ncbi:MAG: hypothetical protein QM699_06890 [Amaricoccus sp.]|uniref:hypothetical protein n=1 Tax=Amaricoccus sp. TaxID=1872485 RepID=UPI0039E3C751